MCDNHSSKKCLPPEVHYVLRCGGRKSLSPENIGIIKRKAYMFAPGVVHRSSLPNISLILERAGQVSGTQLHRNP
ncbi:MAG: hypothetical protein N3G21_01335 [Candidatus Hydrogenedentes bacterium]|nr:hypothetical protein [Candidatus Hydrogenedentota bacterium]